MALMAISAVFSPLRTEGSEQFDELCDLRVGASHPLDDLVDALRAHQVPEERESSVNHLIVVLDRYGPPQDVDYSPYPRWDVVFLGCAGAKGLV